MAEVTKKSPEVDRQDDDSNEDTAVQEPTSTEGSSEKSTIESPSDQSQGSDAASEPQGQGGPVRVPAGGIDPRLVEERERRREAERDVNVAAPQEATLDPKLAEIRERTKQREAELANRALTKPPERA